MYVGDYLARRCVYTPDKLAFVDVSKDPALRLTYREMNSRANRLANWLGGQGVGRADRVGCVAHSSVFFFDLLFACGKLGAIMVPLNWRLHPREIEALIRRVRPKVLFHSWEPPMDAIARHLHGCDDMPAFWFLEEGHAEDWGRSSRLEEALSEAPDTPVTCESLTELDTACLLFTGGTTGLPKAAQISHRQIVWNAFNTHLGDTHHTDIYLNVFPTFHTGGLFPYPVPLLILGGTVIQTKRVDAGEILTLIEAEKVTIFSGVPTVFQMLTEAPGWESADLSTLRFCLSGGAPMPVPLIERYQREKGVVFRQGFGMTEFGPSVFSLPEKDAIRKAGSIGFPNFFVDARVVDPTTHRPLPPGEIGELVLRGPSAMTGYFDDPQATKAAFDDEGYFHTGDMARVDEEGYFYIVDRLKDMFISGGENVYPAEIETALYTHPAVKQCAVIGVPDEKWGEVGQAFVVLKPGAEVSQEALIAHLRGHLAGYKVPKSVVFLEALPMSGAGKVLKTELRKMSDQQAETR